MHYNINKCINECIIAQSRSVKNEIKQSFNFHLNNLISISNALIIVCNLIWIYFKLKAVA